jgi:hypothetical protein
MGEHGWYENPYMIGEEGFSSKLGHSAVFRLSPFLEIILLDYIYN